MNIKELTNNLLKISDLYAKRFAIERSSDWHLLKIQEELGELSAAYLKLSKRARMCDVDPLELKKKLEDEIADVLAMLLLFANDQDIDVEKAIKNKWYQYLPSEAD